MKQIRALLVFRDPVAFDENYILNYLWAVQNDATLIREPLPIAYSAQPGTCKDSEGNPYTFMLIDLNVGINDPSQLAELTDQIQVVFVTKDDELPLWHDQMEMMRSVLKLEFDENACTMKAPLGHTHPDEEIGLELQGYGLRVQELAQTPDRGVVQWYAERQGMQVTTVQ